MTHNISKFCQQCGCEIFTAADVGIDRVEYELMTKGALPFVQRFYAPVRTLICRECLEENERFVMHGIVPLINTWLLKRKR